MRPAVGKKLLDNAMATIAQDVELSDGTLVPLGDDTLVATLTKTGTIKTLYRLTSSVWLHWTEAVSVASIPIANNEYKRVMFTGTDQPRMTDVVKAVEGGGTDYPEVSFLAGLPAPATILTTDASTTPDDDKLARVYTYTYVSAWGEEGPPADPTDVIYVTDGDTVNLSNFAGAPSGAYQVESIRIYRALTGSSGDGTYLFVDEIPVAQTTYADSVSDAALAEALKSTLWSAPDTSMQGVTAMANGMLAGYFDNNLCFSEPYQGHAWPEDYRKPLDHTITGLSAAGNMLYVATEGNPYVVVGNSPDYMSENKLETVQTMVSARSFVDIGSGAIYAASDGLILLSEAGAKNITENVVDHDWWAALDPTTIHAYFYKDKYVGFYDNGTTQGGFIFDITDGTFSMISTYGTAGYSDMATGKLYIVKEDNKVYQFDAGEPLTAVWESKHYETPITNFSSARVDAAAYPVTFKVYADGELKFTKSVADAEPFRLPAGFNARTWVIRVETTSTVYGVFMVNATGEL